MGTILIGILILALFILPFILVGMDRKKGKSYLSKALIKIANEHDGNITKSEYWANSAIGLDEKSNQLFFVHTFNGKVMTVHLRLKEYKYCKVQNFSRNLIDKGGDNRAIDKLELELTPVLKDKPVMYLKFFDSEDSKFHTDELVIAEKWANIITQRFKNIK